jgi:AbrB family looped-hinge helix DNA binding protein
MRAQRLTLGAFYVRIIDHESVREVTMATATISSKFQIVIPKEIREKLRLSPRQRFQVLEKGGIITLVPEVPLKSLKGFVKGIDKSEVREKKDRM